MSKTKISEYSATANSNTDVGGINIDEGCAPSGINDAIRTLMAQLKNFQTGTGGDSFNGPVGATTPSTGAFTSITASGDITIDNGSADGGQLLLASSGYSNWGVDNYSGNFRWYYNTTEKMRLDNAGNLGLGVSPSAKFNIGSGGAARFNRSDNATYGEIVYGGAGVGMKYSDANSEGHRFFNGATQSMTLDASGNLGLGTTTTTYPRLTVKQATNGDGYGFAITNSDSTTQGNMFISASGGSALMGFSSTNGIYWGTGGSGTERARIDSSGNFGIGTTSPSQKLHVEASTSATIRLVATGTQTGHITSDSSGFTFNSLSSAPVIFSTANTERARIDSSGNFMVGTTGNSYRISSTVASGADREMFIAGVSGVTNGFQINYINSGSALAVRFNSITTTASAANAFLDSADGNRIYRSTSSLRYKTDIENIEAIRSDSVLNLRPVWYRSKATDDKKDWSWYGLIAEEVAEVEPRLVHWSYLDSDYDFTEENGQIKKTLKEGAKQVPDGVQYERVSVLLIDVVKRQEKAIQEQQAIITQLQADVAALKGQA